MKDKKEEAKQVEDALQVFPNKAPWITSTPSRATSIRTDAMQGQLDQEATLKQSFSPIPPPTATTSDQMTPEELKKLEYLQGLHTMGIELTQQMMTQLESLQAKDQKMAAAKVLSHGHLNRYNKLKSQAESSAKRIVDLDSEWIKFMAKTMDKIRMHASMYQTCRADLLEAHNQKLAELHTVKQEVSVASQSLVGQVVDEYNIPEASSVEAQMQEMQELMQAEGKVVDLPDQIDLTNDFSMEEQEETEDQVETVQKKGSPKLRPFRSATSPLKVANQFLKQKQDPKDAKNKHQEEK